jgi:hypothetical protein
VADVEGWEARMAARAQERGEGWVRVVDERDRAFFLKVAADTNTYRRHLAQMMTLAEAAEIAHSAGWACSCVGDPLCCRHTVAIANITVATATYAVRLVDALYQREAQRG